MWDPSLNVGCRDSPLMPHAMLDLCVAALLSWVGKHRGKQMFSFFFPTNFDPQGRQEHMLGRYSLVSSFVMVPVSSGQIHWGFLKLTSEF